jgi:hypothetical protein
MNRLKIMHHAILANYHSHMVASVFNKHDTANTKRYLHHWKRCREHLDQAERLRVRYIIKTLREDEGVS